jgi:hypothetical protein
MNLTSHFVEQLGVEHQYMVFESTTAFGRYFAGVGVGRLQGGDALLSEVGRGCLERLIQYSDTRARDLGVKKLTMMFVEVRSKQKARERVPQAFLKAPPMTSFFFVCKDVDVYEYVFKMLNVRCLEDRPIISDCGIGS